MKKILMMLLVLFLVCGCVESNEDYKAAKSLFEENKYQEAIEKFNLCKDYKDSMNYLDKCYEGIATDYLSKNKYDDAIKQYQLISDEEHSKELINDATYKKAMYLKDSKKYTDAYYTFEKIKDYKDSSKIMEELMFLKKYEFFDFERDDEKYKDYYNLYVGEVDTNKDAEYVEDMHIQGYYGTWNVHEDNSTFIVDKYFINGRAYHVLAINGNTALISYDDKPEVWYTLNKFHDYYYGEDLSIMNFKTGDEISLSSVTYDEWAAEKAKVPAYSDQEIIDKTVNVMKNKIGSNYDAVDRLYHYCQVESSSVTYDPTTSTYICYVTITYSTNGFNFWGTDNTIYNGSAMYLDTGDDLVTVSFEMS